MPIEALYHSILSHPRDRGLRAVLADALEERGDVRAEFIRLDLEWETLAPCDARWWDVMPRRHTLLAERGKDWIAPNTDIRSAVEQVNDDYDLTDQQLLQPWFGPRWRFDGWLHPRNNWYFRGGFPEILYTPASVFLKIADLLPTKAPVCGLYLGAIFSEGMNEERRGAIARLQELNAPAATIENEEELIAHSQNYPRIGDLLPRLRPLGLRELGLSGIAQGEIDAVAESGVLTGVEELSIASVGSACTSAALRAIANGKGTGNLKSLSCNGHSHSGAEIGDEGCGYLAASRSLSQLRQLVLQGNRVGPSGVEALLGSPHLQHLEELDLSFNLNSPELLTTLLSSGHKQRLRWLELEGCFHEVGYRRENEPLRLPTDCEGASGLMHLGLRGARLGDAGARWIADSVPFRNLRSLDVSSCHIGTEGVKGILLSNYLSNLVSLNMHDNEFAASTLEALAVSPCAKNLRHLTIPDQSGAEDHSAADEFARILARAPFENLVTLRIGDGNRALDARFARILAGSKYLDRLHFISLGCTQETLQILRTRWPELVLLR